MNNEHLRISMSCITCAFFVLQEGEDTLGNCHAGHPTDDKGYPEIDSATGWCGDHTTVEPGSIVPDVVGMSIPFAVPAIKSVENLDVGTITRIEGEEGGPKDEVTAQDPTGGTPVAAHSKVKLIATNK